MTRVLLAAGLLVAAACSGEPGAAPDAGASSSGAVPPPTDAPADPAPTLEIVCAGLEEVILLAYPSRSGLRDRYGAPDSTTSEAVPNRHVEGATDTLFTVFYPGLVAELHKPSGGRDLADLVTVADNRYLAIPEVGIGATEDAVISAIGAPLRYEDGALVYWCGEGAEQPVRFELADGRVRAVVVDYYVD